MSEHQHQHPQRLSHNTQREIHSTMIQRLIMQIVFGCHILVDQETEDTAVEDHHQAHASFPHAHNQFTPL